MVYFLFIIGFIFLIKGADLLIEGSTNLAKKFGVSDLIIGLTVVAFGTSLPELIVNLFAGSESGDLAIGNIVGSNIANILLILGIASIIKPLTVHKNTVYREIVFNIGAAAALTVLVSERLLTQGGFNGLDRIDGIILISYFAIFLYYTFGKSNFADKKQRKKAKELNIDMPKSIFNIALGGLGLFWGGKWIVSGAVELAGVFGASDALVGLTIVAIGTSLPELAASVIAVRKNNVDIAVGNAVGSNLFNIFWVLGLSAFVNPLPFSDSIAIDVYIMFLISIGLFLTMVLGKNKHEIAKNEGIVFLSLYGAYLVYAVSQGI